MSLKSVMLQLHEEQLAQLDAEASRLGVSRSRLVRDCVDQSFAGRFDARVAEAYERAFASPAADTDDWGSLDDWHTAAARARAEGDRDTW
jgi:hypothetical protein